MGASAVAVIPARYGSERYPGKPLAMIAGVPMVVRVVRNAALARSVDRVIVATDDERVAAAVETTGAEVMMTEPDVPSGTDRVWLAAWALDAGIIVNVQGDEPLLPGAVIDDLVDVLRRDGSWDLATPVTRSSRLAATGADVVTVACDEAGAAQYFSRTVIPWGADPVWRHIGVYAYRKEALRRFVATPASALERVERLEQLRALALGMRIAAVEVDVVSHGVDRPEDVVVVERMLAEGEEHGAPPRRRSARPKLVVLDVDGVLTDGSITYAGDGEQIVTFDVKDGQGIVSMVKAGLDVAVLTARDSAALRRRAAELGIIHVGAAVTDKAAALVKLCADLGVDLDEVCYVGDDEGDAGAMALAGFSVAPADAAPVARARAHLTTARPGGKGAVRELADLLLGR